MGNDQQSRDFHEEYQYHMTGTVVPATNQKWSLSSSSTYSSFPQATYQNLTNSQYGHPGAGLGSANCYLQASFSQPVVVSHVNVYPGVHGKYKQLFGVSDYFSGTQIQVYRKWSGDWRTLTTCSAIHGSNKVWTFTLPRPCVGQQFRLYRTTTYMVTSHLSF